MRGCVKTSIKVNSGEYREMRVDNTVPSELARKESSNDCWHNSDSEYEEQKPFQSSPVPSAGALDISPIILAGQSNRAHSTRGSSTCSDPGHVES